MFVTASLGAQVVQIHARGRCEGNANGQTLEEIVFKFTPQGVITGHVLDEDGEPLQNVQIGCLNFGTGDPDYVNPHESAGQDVSV